MQIIEYSLILKEYSLIGKIGSFKLQISSSNLDALVIFTFFMTEILYNLHTFFYGTNSIYLIKVP